ncbi:hypothetical protein J6590_000363 [Homalodisca vitripennis]|nr:hypothetical protein J6590_000363 [Homalodisca vitripennis]
MTCSYIRPPPILHLPVNYRLSYSWAGTEWRGTKPITAGATRTVMANATAPLRFTLIAHYLNHLPCYCPVFCTVNKEAVKSKWLTLQSTRVLKDNNTKRKAGGPERLQLIIITSDGERSPFAAFLRAFGHALALSRRKRKLADKIEARLTGALERVKKRSYRRC